MAPVNRNWLSGEKNADVTVSKCPCKVNLQEKEIGNNWYFSAGEKSVYLQEGGLR
jgi:hypothetical protein